MCLLSDNIIANTCKTSKNDVQSLNMETPSKQNIKLVLYTNKWSTKCYLAQITAQYSGKCLTVKQIENDKNSSSDIILETTDVTLSESNAIAYFLSNSQLRREDDLAASSQVLQWMMYAKNHILPAASTWVLSSCDFPVSKGMRPNVKATEDSKEDVLWTLKRLDDLLCAKTYLVGERTSLADISVFTALLPLYEYVLDGQLRNQYTNLNRWFSTILNQPQVKCVIKHMFSAETTRRL